MSDLRPCPFCGDIPAREEDGETGCTIECTNGQCSVGPSVYRDHEEFADGVELATVDWNTRAAAPVAGDAWDFEKLKALMEDRYDMVCINGKSHMMPWNIIERILRDALAHDVLAGKPEQPAVGVTEEIES